jgi:hypothetical protein
MTYKDRWEGCTGLPGEEMRQARVFINSLLSNTETVVDFENNIFDASRCEDC